MTRENLEQKLAAFEKQYEQTISNLNAMSGAIQLLKQLLAEEGDKAQPPVKESPEREVPISE